jgi:hypothetical protein
MKLNTDQCKIWFAISRKNPEMICRPFPAKTIPLTGRLINKISDKHSKYLENSNVSKNAENHNAEHPTKNRTAPEGSAEQR